MVDTVENLILDLLEWVGRRERTYQETMEAWRTSCPRLPVWEDATDRGLVETEHASGRSIVRVTPSGLAFLRERRSPIDLTCKSINSLTARRPA
jgi:DNA-binding PadR family transcriptional regulator